MGFACSIRLLPNSQPGTDPDPPSARPAARAGPHCLNAGRPATVSDGGALTWPAGKHGVCGDPWNAARRHEAGGEFATGAITAPYAEGSNVRAERRAQRALRRLESLPPSRSL